MSCNRPTVVIVKQTKKEKCCPPPSCQCPDWQPWVPSFIVISADPIPIETFGLSVYRNTGNFVEFQTGFNCNNVPPAAGEYPLFGPFNRFVTIALEVPIPATVPITDNNFSGVASLFFYNGDAESVDEARQKALQYDTTPIGINVKANDAPPGPNTTTVLLSFAANNTLANSQSRIWIRGIYRLS